MIINFFKDIYYALPTEFWLAVLGICIAAYIVEIIAEAIILSKAGRPAWAILVPFWGTWHWYDMAMDNGVIGVIVILLYLVPIRLTRIICSVINAISVYNVSKRFGKSEGFSIASAIVSGFLGFNPFLWVIAFGGAEYDEAGAMTNFINARKKNKSAKTNYGDINKYLK